MELQPLTEPRSKPKRKTVYLYVDVEATGSHNGSQPWQIAYCIGDGKGRGNIKDEYLTITDRVSLWVLDNTEFLAYRSKKKQSPEQFARKFVKDVGKLANAVLYVVGANPGGDWQTLKSLVEDAGLPLPFHFTPICVEVLAMPLFGLSEPVGLDRTAKLCGLERKGNAHDAVSDIELTYRVHAHLMKLIAAAHPSVPAIALGDVNVSC